MSWEVGLQPLTLFLGWCQSVWTAETMQLCTEPKQRSRLGCLCNHKTSLKAKLVTRAEWQLFFCIYWIPLPHLLFDWKLEVWERIPGNPDLKVSTFRLTEQVGRVGHGNHLSNEMAETAPIHCVVLNLSFPDGTSCSLRKDSTLLLLPAREEAPTACTQKQPPWWAPECLTSVCSLENVLTAQCPQPNTITSD